MKSKSISTNETVQQIQLTNCFPSAFLTTSLGTPLNCLNGVMLPHILFSTILHKSKAAFAGTAHPRFKQISKIALRILPAPPLDYKQMRETEKLTVQLIVGRTPYLPRVRTHQALIAKYTPVTAH